MNKEELGRLRQWIEGLTDGELMRYGSIAVKPSPSETPEDQLTWAGLRILLGDEINRRSAARSGDKQG